MGTYMYRVNPVPKQLDGLTYYESSYAYKCGRASEDEVEHKRRCAKYDKAWQEKRLAYKDRTVLVRHHDELHMISGVTGSFTEYCFDKTPVGHFVKIGKRTHLRMVYPDFSPVYPPELERQRAMHQEAAHG